MPRVSVIMVTARLEKESFFPQWKEIAEAIRTGDPCPYGPLSLVREPFRRLLLDCVRPEMNSFLEPTLESLKRQTFQDFEVIVVDWHALHRDIADHYHEDLDLKHVWDKPSPWRAMKVPEGWEAEVEPAFPTVNNARNTGVILAEGGLLCFLDDNIILEPKTLETAWKWYEKGYGVKFIRNRYNVGTERRKGREITLELEFRDGLYDVLWEKGRCTYSYRGAWSHGFTIPLDAVLEVNGWEEVLLDGTVGAEDIDMGRRLHNLLEKPERRQRMVLDVDATVWELGHLHIMVGRPGVRLNVELLNAVRDWEEDTRANVRKPTPEELGAYRREMEGRGERLHPYWDRFPVEPFSLREQRERYLRGELAWQ